MGSFTRTLIFILITSLAQAKLVEDFSIVNINVSSVSERCRHQVKAVETALLGLKDERHRWVLKMLDAGSRFLPSGVMNGNFFDIGNYEECLSIEANEDDAPKIFGQYCLSTIQYGFNSSDLPFQQQNVDLNKTRFPDFQPRMLDMMDTKTVGFHLAFCVPNECTAEDLNAGLGPILIFNSDFCRTKDTDKDFSTGAIIGIVFFCGVLVIAAMSTAYDVHLQNAGKKPQSQLFIAFSVYTNGLKILNKTKGGDQLSCINGLKAISMMWVVLGHEFTLQGMAVNYFSIIEWSQDSANMFIIGATVSVDTFFTIGGLLTVYTYLKACDKGVKFNVILYYVHRYLRLTPALAVVIIFYVTLLPYMGDGPLWSVVRNDLVRGCENYWWQDLLYIQNYVVSYMDKAEICIAQTWYLGVDMQLFLLSPLILVPLYRWPKYTVGALIVLIIAGIVSPFVIAWEYNISGLIVGMQADSMQKYYMATHARFGPYVIGMLAGYLIYQMKKVNRRIHIRKQYVIIFWILLIAGLTAIVYGGYDLIKNKDRVPNSIFVGFHRNAWGLGICLLIMACTFGYGGPINSFLSFAPFQFVAKLSYSMYLVHYAVIQARVASARSTYYFSNSEMFFLFWGYFTETLFISLVLCLLFESPMITIERLLFGVSSTKPREVKSEPA